MAPPASGAASREVRSQIAGSRRGCPPSASLSTRRRARASMRRVTSSINIVPTPLSLHVGSTASKHEIPVRLLRVDVQELAQIHAADLQRVWVGGRARAASSASARLHAERRRPMRRCKPHGDAHDPVVVVAHDDDASVATQVADLTTKEDRQRCEREMRRQARGRRSTHRRRRRGVATPAAS